MNRIIFLFSLVVVLLAACKTETIFIDSSLPNGTFAAAKSGSLVEQNGTGTAGTVELGTDEDDVQFLRFGSNFTTNLGTGTVTVYLSTSENFVADPANGNPDLRQVGPISKTGETYFKLDPVAAAKFTHVILWCGSANIPFGNAALN
ncbi:MAG: DM13 domain-containing protein [Bacteroidia bacterium]